MYLYSTEPSSAYGGSAWGRIGKFIKRLGEDVEGGEDWELCLQYCTGTLPRTSVWFDLFKIEPSAESRDI